MGDMPNASSLLTAVRARGRRAAGRLVHRGWTWVQGVGAVSNQSPGPYRFRELGDGTKLAFPLGTVFNEQWITIGPFSIIGERVTISAGFVPGLDLGDEPIVRIGGGCVIGRGSHLVGHQSITLGDDVWTGPFVYITDTAHSYHDTELPIGKQWPRNEPVEIGSGSWIGTGAVILPGAKLGRNVVVAANSVVRGEVPDFAVVAGAPAKVVRSWSEAEGWQPPFRHEPPTALPGDLTADQLRELIGWDLRLPGEEA
ncbi:acyltransferase [Kitasatospora gansuensis]